MVHMAVTPNLKSKVDELFLRWLSMPATQRILHDDLNKVIEGRPISPKQQCLLSSSSGGGSRAASPPAPSSSPTPVRSPRSPREVRSLRKSGARNSPRSPEPDRHAPNKPMKTTSLYLSDEKHSSSKITAGCASNIPKFYFPHGKPPKWHSSEVDATLKKLVKVFEVFEKGCVKKEHFSAVTKVSVFIFLALIKITCRVKCSTVLIYPKIILC